MPFSTVPVNRKGLTLIELLTVIALLGILSAILLPAVGRIKNSAHNAKCLSNLRSIGAAIHLYANESSGLLPSGIIPRDQVNNIPQIPWHKGLRPYLGGDGTDYSDDQTSWVFVCPAAAQPTGRADPQYSANPLLFSHSASPLKIDDVVNPSRVVMVADGAMRVQYPTQAHSLFLTGSGGLNVRTDAPDSLVRTDVSTEQRIDYRHTNDEVYTLMVDGAVQGYAKGMLRSRNFSPVN